MFSPAQVKLPNQSPAAWGALVLGVAIGIHLHAGFTFADQTPVEKTLQAWRKVFKKEVTNHAGMFAINKDFGLRLQFSGDELASVSIYPKYVWEDAFPNSSEPEKPASIHQSEAEDFLSRIHSIRPLGELKKKSEVGLVTSMKAHFVDRYDRAYVRRVLHAGTAGQKKGESYFGIKVFYIRTIEGLVAGKSDVTDFLWRQHVVTIDEGRFYVSAAVFKKLVIGKKERFLGAGPI